MTWAEHTERVLDPVCGMTVDVAKAEEAGLTTEHEGRTYAFCRAGCLRAFAEEPATYAAKADQAHAITVPQAQGLPIIDEGMRRWYELLVLPVGRLPGHQGCARRRRDAKSEAPADAGICEVAEAQEVATP